MFGILKEVFTWWHNQTIGTRLFTFVYGHYVGQDTQNNRYYTTRDKRRRWVIYHGLVEASRIPPLWDAWLRHTIDDAPPQQEIKAGVMRFNSTGTPFAYHPSGSLHESQPTQYRSYKAWRPTSDE